MKILSLGYIQRKFIVCIGRGVGALAQRRSQCRSNFSSDKPAPVCWLTSSLPPQLQGSKEFQSWMCSLATRPTEEPWHWADSSIRIVHYSLTVTDIQSSVKEFASKTGDRCSTWGYGTEWDYPSRPDGRKKDYHKTALLYDRILLPLNAVLSRSSLSYIFFARQAPTAVAIAPNPDVYFVPNISQGSVATRLRRDGIFIDDVSTNLLPSLKLNRIEN